MTIGGTNAIIVPASPEPESKTIPAYLNANDGAASVVMYEGSDATGTIVFSKSSTRLDYVSIGDIVVTIGGTYFIKASGSSQTMQLRSEAYGANQIEITGSGTFTMPDWDAFYVNVPNIF
jgi:hypothetical protein